MNKFLALVRRALQTEARLARGHLFRCLLGGFVLWTLITARWQIFSLGAPGLNLFRSMTYYNYFFITILGTAFFATAITEEKEERTLGLLKMAGVGPTALILGKWTPRMIAAFLLLSVQIPFTVLATTLGGILWEQIGAAYTSLFAHLFLVGSIGLFCSVTMTTTTGACLLALGSLLFLNTIPTIINGLYGNLAYSFIGEILVNFASYLRSMSAFQAIPVTLSTGFNDSWFSTQVINNLIVGTSILVVTWAIFDLCTQNEKEATKLGYFDRLRKRFKGRERGRVWDAAFIWKDYQLLGGGFAFLAMKFVLYFLFMFIFALSIGFGPTNFREALGGVMIWWSVLFLIFETGIMTARLYRNEINEKTWASLVMLPRSKQELIYGKLIGGLSVTIPCLLCFLIGTTLVLDEFLEGLNDLLSEGEAVLAFAYFVQQVLIGIHLATYLSISQKWAIWPMAVFLAGFIVFIANVTVLGCLFSGVGPSDAGPIFFVGNVASAICNITIHNKIGGRLILAGGE